MMNLRKAAVRLQKATSYEGASQSCKRLRISPSNEQLASPHSRTNGGDSAVTETDKNNIFNRLCFGYRQRKRRRLQFAGASRGTINGNGGTEVTFIGGNLSFRQFSGTNQRYFKINYHTGILFLEH